MGCIFTLLRFLASLLPPSIVGASGVPSDRAQTGKEIIGSQLRPDYLAVAGPATEQLPHGLPSDTADMLQGQHTDPRTMPRIRLDKVRPQIPYQ
jgi:hypothetical protein